MYKILDPEHYTSLSPESRLQELQLWLEGQLENHRAVLRSVAGTIPEIDMDIEEVMNAEFNELGQLINNYQEGSAARAILAYRIQNNIQDYDENVLDIEAVAKVTTELCRDCDSEEDQRTVTAHRSFAEDMAEICRILCFKDLEKAFTLWCP